MEIQTLTPGGFAANCYLLREGNDAVLIDCTATVADVEKALQAATLHAVLLTHGHFDHMLTTAQICAHFGAPIYLHVNDESYPADGEKNAFSLFFGTSRTYPSPHHTLRHHDRLCFGKLTLDVTHVPGHTQGCVLYRAGNALFTGDTLFAAGVGRTDLYGGDSAKLLASLDTLRTFPRSLRIYPGHGEDAVLGAALDRLSYYL